MGFVRRVVTITDIFFFEGTMSISHRRRQTVDTVSDIVTCRLVISLSLYNLLLPFNLQKYQRTRRGCQLRPLRCLSQFKLFL